MEQLRDIKDIVEVNDHSFEILLGLIFLVVLVLSIIFYLYKNRRKRRKKLTPKEKALQSLKSIDYSNPKEVAYRFTTDGYLWLNEENEKEYRDIEKELLAYKYKRDVPQVDEVLKKRVEKFIKELK
jgi:flagellar biosynthesis/type III secretory pathway M-ring protein FliF/YscJ